MPEGLETPPSPTLEETPTPSLVTEAVQQPTNDPNNPAEPIVPNEPKQPGDKPDDSPVQEPQPLQPTDLSFPEGFEVNEQLRDDFISVFNDAEKSPQERAQALIDLQVKAAQTASEASSKLWTDMQAQWQTETKAAPEFAGDKLQPALDRVGRLINEFGSDELKGVLDLTGAGNSVHVIRFLDKVAEKLTEAAAPATGAPVNQTADRAQRLFPSMKG